MPWLDVSIVSYSSLMKFPSRKINESNQHGSVVLWVAEESGVYKTFLTSVEWKTKVF